VGGRKRAVIVPPAKRGGGKRRVDMREVVNGITYILTRVARGTSCRKACHRKALFCAQLAAERIEFELLTLDAYRSQQRFPIAGSARTLMARTGTL